MSLREKLTNSLPGILTLLIIAALFALWQDFEDMAEFIRDFSGALLFVGVIIGTYQLRPSRAQVPKLYNNRLLSKVASYIPLGLGLVVYFVWLSALYSHLAVTVLAKGGVTADAQVTSYYYVHYQAWPGWLAGLRRTDDANGPDVREVVKFKLTDGTSGITNIPLDSYSDPGRYSNLQNQITAGHFQIRYLPQFPALALPNVELTDPHSNPPY